MNKLNPSELARETLKTLAQRRLPPSPDNYTKIYSEISGIPTQENKGAEKILRDLADQLMRTDRSAASGIALKRLINEEKWDKCYKEIEKVLPKPDSDNAAPQSWPVLIRDLLRQLDIPHKGVTVSRKKEGLETVLTRFASNPDASFEKLSNLIRSWSESPVTTENLIDNEAAITDSVVPNPATPPQVTTTPVTTTQVVMNTTPSSIQEPAPSLSAMTDDNTTVMLGKLSELLTLTLESTISGQPELAEDVRKLIDQVRAIKTVDDISSLKKQLRQYWLNVELRGGDKVKIQEGLIRLLRLLVENVGEMVENEDWLHGQITTLQEIITNPVDTRVIADAERSLRDAIIKQGLLNKSLTDAKTTLKTLMSTFIDRLGTITISTGDYHDKIEGYSQKIASSNNLNELGHLLEDIMQDTRVIQASTLRSHEELVNSRKQVEEAEARISMLQKELAEVSELVHQDQLTGALNRRGLDAAFERDAKLADRNLSSLCVSLLDIDNFKRMNDTMGHHVGDQALIHLTHVITEALRPGDTVARYGGEEFVILLPDVSLEEAAHTIERLQRELTKQFFLHENDRVLVTFSAGVALRGTNEPQDEVIGRADRAMYHAKRTGKNRVVIAE